MTFDPDKGKLRNSLSRRRQSSFFHVMFSFKKKKKTLFHSLAFAICLSFKSLALVVLTVTFQHQPQVVKEHVNTEWRVIIWNIINTNKQNCSKEESQCQPKQPCFHKTCFFNMFSTKQSKRPQMKHSDHARICLQ